MMNKGFCIKPWVHSSVRTNGDIVLCCISQDRNRDNIKEVTIKQWWNSDYLNSIRQQMLNGTLPKECSVCASNEAKNIPSLREKSNSHFNITNANKEKAIKHLFRDQPSEIEFALTNLCNFKCLMCDGTFSSSILTEDKILNIITRTQTDYDVTDATLDQIKDWIKTKPKKIHFVGGESFMLPRVKELVNSIINCNLQDSIELSLVTNLSKYDDWWHETLKKFKNVTIMVSMDGVGAVNDYIRYGGKWEIFESNLKRLRETGAKLVIHTTVMNLNIFHLPEIIEYCRQNGLSHDLDFLKKPDFLSVNTMPLELKYDAKSLFDSTHIIQDIITLDQNDHLWSKCIEYITIKDEYRGNNVLNINPQFKEYWHAKTK